jgi:hypothetical protein
VSADFGVSTVTLAGRAAGSGRKLQRIVVERIIRGLLSHRLPLNTSFWCCARKLTFVFALLTNPTLVMAHESRHIRPAHCGSGAR